MAAHCDVDTPLLPGDTNDCKSYSLCVPSECSGNNVESFQCPGELGTVGLGCFFNASDCAADTQIVPPICGPDDIALPDDSDPTKFWSCHINVTTTIVGTRYYCPTGFLYDPENNNCGIYNDSWVAPPECGRFSQYGGSTSPDFSSDNDCIAPVDAGVKIFYYDTECTEAGTFPDGYCCKDYYVCYVDECGNLRRSRETCPGDTKYDFQNAVCDNIEKCKCLCRYFSLFFSILNESLVFPRVVYFTQVSGL